MLMNTDSSTTSSVKVTNTTLKRILSSALVPLVLAMPSIGCNNQIPTNVDQEEFSIRFLSPQPKGGEYSNYYLDAEVGDSFNVVAQALDADLQDISDQLRWYSGDMDLTPSSSAQWLINTDNVDVTDLALGEQEITANIQFSTGESQNINYQFRVVDPNGGYGTSLYFAAPPPTTINSAQNSLLQLEAIAQDNHWGEISDRIEWSFDGETILSGAKLVIDINNILAGHHQVTATVYGPEQYLTPTEWGPKKVILTKDIFIIHPPGHENAAPFEPDFTAFVECDKSIYQDGDGDGITDQCEAEGTTFYGMPLHWWGARPDQPDLFIEIDYMADQDAVLGEHLMDQPREGALQLVIESFAKEGIAVHFDVGDLYDQSESYAGAPRGMYPTRFDLGGGNQVPYRSADFINPSNTDLPREYRGIYQSPERRNIFYYMLFRRNDNHSIQGVARIAGIDAMISPMDSVIYTTQKRDQKQAAVIMHEFGHNLNLRHNGNKNLPKGSPVYYSVMNYWYDDGSVPLSGEPLNRGAGCSYNYNPVLYHLDYSHGLNAAIDESSLMEADGVGPANHPDKIALDFNCNQQIDANPVKVDLNNEYGWGGNGQLEVLEDHDDWGSLYFYFVNIHKPVTTTNESQTQSEDVVN